MFERPTSDPRTRFYLLDALRGIAALIVVFRHYHHFFMLPGQTSPAGDIAVQQPLYPALRLFYDHGDFAVPFFWVISGFVLAHGYGATSATTRTFFVARMARLYPLHILTLVVVALLQLGAQARYGASLFFANNDASSFLLHLAFASDWGFTPGRTFNAPIWSVSVEVLIYAAFWAVHGPLLRRGALYPAILALAFLALTAVTPDLSIGPCGYFFFIGSALYCVFSAFRTNRLAIAAALPVGLLGAAAMTLPHKIAMAVGAPLLFAALVLLATLLEGAWSQRHRASLSFVGDTTYGAYLWHVPLQMTIYLLVSDAAALARSPLFLIAYICAVITLARLSFSWFERPMRTVLRERFGTPRNRAGPALGAGGHA